MSIKLTVNCYTCRMAIYSIFMDINLHDMQNINADTILIRDKSAQSTLAGTEDLPFIYRPITVMYRNGFPTITIQDIGGVHLMITDFVLFKINRPLKCFRCGTVVSTLFRAPLNINELMTPVELINASKGVDIYTHNNTQCYMLSDSYLRIGEPEYIPPQLGANEARLILDVPYKSLFSPTEMVTCYPHTEIRLYPIPPPVTGQETIITPEYCNGYARFDYIDFNSNEPDEIMARVQHTPVDIIVDGRATGLWIDTNDINDSLMDLSAELLMDGDTFMISFNNLCLPVTPEMLVFLHLFPFSSCSFAGNIEGYLWMVHRMADKLQSIAEASIPGYIHQDILTCRMMLGICMANMGYYTFEQDILSRFISKIA